MTGKCENDNYIKCSRCTCKYINDDEHIRKDFGYNRLNERCKCCVKCRDKGVAYSQSAKAVEWKQTSVVCEKGETTTKRIIATHKRQYKCQTHTMCPKVSYREWVLGQDYYNLLWLDQYHNYKNNTDWTTRVKSIHTDKKKSRVTSVVQMFQDLI